jgi:proteasome lid subunit RPN8/RPN11
MTCAPNAKKKVRQRKMNNNTKTKIQRTADPKTKVGPRQARLRSRLRAKEINGDGPRQPVLRFSPTAWAKLLYFRDKTENEVGGFGIAEPDDLLCVTDFVTVRQKVSPVSVSFYDEAVADYFDRQVDLGRKPEQFARIWLHTHPDFSPAPSSIDEDTFARVFGRCHWALMFIVAGDNRAYARLGFNVGPGGQVLIPVEVDYSADFGPSNKQAWEAEYGANIEAEKPSSRPRRSGDESSQAELGDYGSADGLVEELENMDPWERQLVLSELAARPDLWEEESEVVF